MGNGFYMPLNAAQPSLGTSPQDNPFKIRDEVGDGNRFGVQADSIIATVGQRVLKEGASGMWDSIGVFAKQTAEGDLIVEVLVFNPDWDEPLRIACIRSRPADRSCLTPLACSLEHVTL
jgi:hypothetical protein